MDTNAFYTKEEIKRENGNDDSNEPCLVAFNGPISSRTYKYENYYYFSYKVPDGYAFNKKTKILVVINIFDISEYDIVEDRVCNEFENLLKSKGYKSIDKNLFESPKGTVVGLGYSEGKLRLYYYFNKGTYVDIDRELRTKKAKKTPEGMPKDETKEDVDSVAVVD